MGRALPIVDDDWVDEKIRGAVEHAATTGGVIWTSELVAGIVSSFPDVSFDESLLTDRLLWAASAAGVAVRIGGAAPESA